MLRPGFGIRNVKANEFVTFGAYGLTKGRKVVLVTCAHGIVYFRGGEDTIGDSIVRVKALVEEQELGDFRRLSFSGEEFDIKGVKLSSFRISGIGDDLPAVLKPPALAAERMEVAKSGVVTGVTFGQIIEASCPITVELSDGRKVKFVDQIKTSVMATHGDSGSLLLTARSFEPLGLLVAAARNRRPTYFCKMTNVIDELKLLGVFCPLSLSSMPPAFLKYLASRLVWDGRYEQKSNLMAKDSEKILEELGVESVSQFSGENWNVTFRGAFVVSMPFVKSDLGNVLMNQRNKAVGVIVGGNEAECIAIPIENLLKAFGLNIVL